MATSRMKKNQRVLTEIEKVPKSDYPDCKQLKEILKGEGVAFPNAGNDSPKDRCIKALHTAWQTELMADACNSAKWSCFWAFIAAGIALLGVIATLITVIVR
jgi:hypothetical protein